MGTSELEKVRGIAARLHEQHRALAQALDAVVTLAAKVRSGAARKGELEDAIYDLYVRFDDHLVDEDRLLRPVVEWLGADEAARVHLVFGEHEDQRRIFLSALEHTEQGTLDGGELTRLAGRLVRSLRADLELEEELLDDLAGRPQRTSTR